MRDESNALRAGEPTPAFRLERAQGGWLGLDDLAGRTVALYFFRGTW